MHVIKIPYFPKGLKYCTPLLFAGAGFLAWKEHPIWAFVLIFLTLVILTTAYVTIIDTHKKTITDSINVIWIPLGTEFKKFHTTNKIVITKGNYSQTINTRSQSRQLDWSDYTGTLLLDDHDSIDLITDTDKSSLIVRLQLIATELGVPVEDQTRR